MAYVVVQPRSDGLPVSLEGSPLRHGDALWVPANGQAGDVVHDWLPAVFVEADAQGQTLTLIVAVEDRARMALPMQVGVRRREQRGPS